MLAYILLILVLAIVVIAAVIIFGLVFGRGETLPPAEDSHTLMEANRRAIEENRYGDVRLEIAWRGYRPEQVDSLLEALLAKEEALREKEALQQKALQPPAAQSLIEETGEPQIELEDDTISQASTLQFVEGNEDTLLGQEPSSSSPRADGLPPLGVD